MGKFKIVFYLLLFLPCSCINLQDDLDIGSKTLAYTGDNEIGKLLLTKLEQCDVDIPDASTHSEILFDYTVLSSIGKYGLGFSVPLKNIKNDKIESYLIFKIHDDEEDVKFNFDNNRLDEIILIDSIFLDTLDEEERYIYSSRFLQYRNQGLQVIDGLCDFVEKWNENMLNMNSRSDNSIQPLNVRFLYKVSIFFNIDYNPPPSGITSWALSLNALTYIFLNESYSYITAQYPVIKGYENVSIGSNSVELWLETRDPHCRLRDILWLYMLDVTNRMRNYSSVNGVFWGIRVEGNFDRFTLGNGGDIPPPTEGSGENPGVPTEPEESCADQKCPYCLGCIRPTSANCYPCDCFGVEIVLGTDQTSLLNNYEIVAIPKTPSGGFFPTFYIFEMAEANSGAWFTIYQGMAPTYTRTAVQPGKWDIRVRARVDGRIVTSEVLQVEKLYPSYNDIVGNSLVQSKMNSLWSQTIANTTVYTRQELGCYIYVDAQEKTYKFEEFSGNEAGPNERATIEAEYPSLTSETSHLVGFFHTHTGCTYLNVGQVVGPSTEDIEAARQLGVVGILYDYIGVPNPYGTGMIIMPGHNLNDPATYSHFGVYRRPLN